MGNFAWAHEHPKFNWKRNKHLNALSRNVGVPKRKNSSDPVPSQLRNHNHEAEIQTSTCAPSIFKTQLLHVSGTRYWSITLLTLVQTSCMANLPGPNSSRSNNRIPVQRRRTSSRHCSCDGNILSPFNFLLKAETVTTHFRELQILTSLSFTLAVNALNVCVQPLSRTVCPILTIIVAHVRNHLPRPCVREAVLSSPIALRCIAGSAKAGDGMIDVLVEGEGAWHSTPLKLLSRLSSSPRRKLALEGCGEGAANPSRCMTSYLPSCAYSTWYTPSSCPGGILYPWLRAARAPRSMVIAAVRMVP